MVFFRNYFHHSAVYSRLLDKTEVSKTTLKIYSLPEKVLERITSYLSDRDLKNLASTDKHFRKFIVFGKEMELRIEKINLFFILKFNKYPDLDIYTRLITPYYLFFKNSIYFNFFNKLIALEKSIHQINTIKNSSEDELKIMILGGIAKCISLSGNILLAHQIIKKINVDFSKFRVIIVISELFRFFSYAAINQGNFLLAKNIAREIPDDGLRWVTQGEIVKKALNRNELQIAIETFWCIEGRLIKSTTLKYITEKIAKDKPELAKKLAHEVASKTLLIDYWGR